MKKKRIVIVVMFFVIVIIMLILGIIMTTNNQKETNKISFEETATKYIENLNNEIINGTNEENLLEILKVDSLPPKDIMTGNDMFLVAQFADEENTTYNLDENIELSEDLRSNLEKEIQDNFSYSIKSINKEDDNTVFEIEYTTFNYNSYLNDLGILEMELLIRAGYDLNNLEESMNVLIDIYKADIKSAMLLNDYLDTYKTTTSLTTSITFINNNIEESSNSFYEYFKCLRGLNYEQVSLFETEEEIDTFLNNFDLSNPLEI